MQKVDFVQSQFQKVDVTLAEFICLSCLHRGYYEKVALKLENFRRTNIFTMEMFDFANFAQKVESDRSRFQELVVALTEIYLFELF